MTGSKIYDEHVKMTEMNHQNKYEMYGQQSKDNREDQKQFKNHIN